MSVLYSTESICDIRFAQKIKKIQYTPCIPTIASDKPEDLVPVVPMLNHMQCSPKVGSLTNKAKNKHNLDKNQPISSG